MHLYVEGLAPDATDGELNQLFSKIGQVASVTIIKDIDSGRPRGISIVKMARAADAEKAVKQLNGTTLGSRQILVTVVPEILPGEMEFREWLREHALEVLGRVGVSQGQTVLDYGCGSGVFTIPSARIVGKQGKIYALEVRSNALQRVNEKAKNERLGNIETILSESSEFATGLPGESVDVILVYDVMHEIDDRQGLLEELHKVLKQDGFLSIFPMHMGTDKMLEIMKDCPLFRFRDRYAPPRHKTASEILNFEKC